MRSEMRSPASLQTVPRRYGPSPVAQAALYCEADRRPRRALRTKHQRFIVHAKSSRPKMRVLGRHIVSDPRICHGKPTFRGTRVRVEDVLEQVASGMAWETIIEEWNRSVTVEAIREAVQLASQALAKHADEFVLATKSA